MNLEKSKYGPNKGKYSGAKKEKEANPGTSSKRIGKKFPNKLNGDAQKRPEVDSRQVFRTPGIKTRKSLAMFPGDVGKMETLKESVQNKKRNEKVEAKQFSSKNKAAQSRFPKANEKRLARTVSFGFGVNDNPFAAVSKTPVESKFPGSKKTPTNVEKVDDGNVKASIKKPRTRSKKTEPLVDPLIEE